MNVLIDDPIWWSTDDFILFKTDALEELRELMSRHSHLDPKMASRLLYQPEYDTEFGGLLDSTQHLSFRCLEHPEDVNPNQHDLESGYCVAWSRRREISQHLSNFLMTFAYPLVLFITSWSIEAYILVVVSYW